MILAQQSLRPTYDAARLAAVDHPWFVPALVAAALVILAVCWIVYRRDSVELSPGVGWFLLSMRAAAVVAVFAFYLKIEKRVDRVDVVDSRVLILADTSLSLGKTDSDPATDLPPASDPSAGALPDAGPTRIEQVVAALTDGLLVDRLREKHRVDIYRFDAQPNPVLVATLPKSPVPQPAAQSASDPQYAEASDAESRPLTVESVRRAVPRAVWIAIAAVGAAWTLLALVWIVPRLRAGGTFFQWVFAVAGCATPALPLVALAALIVTERDVMETAADRPNPISESSDATDDSERVTDKSSDVADDPARAEVPGDHAGGVNPRDEKSNPKQWRDQLRDELVARGVETRLGDALQRLVHDERANPVGGVILVTDGGQNAGVDPKSATAAALEAAMHVFPVGIGSDRRPANLRISEFTAPARVFPEDGFHITASLQSIGLAGRIVTVDLFSVPGAAKPGAVETPEQSVRATLAADGEIAPVKFAMVPGELGRRTYIVRVQAPREDHDKSDNVAQATVEVVDRKLRVLLFAGGPSREYQFLRNQLYRDKSVVVDVALQTAIPTIGVSQDVDHLLETFPETKAELAEYDAIVAFDPDWTSLSPAQVDLLEEWVARGAGGLVGIAGPVHTATWASNANAPPSMAKVRSLYPVIFPRRVMRFDLDKFRSTSPWPIQLSREGLQAPPLWVDDTAALSQYAWEQFDGVYGYFPIRGQKPGAVVYGRYTDPAAGELPPVYFAGHFYGAGRVFYMGSGEMWRIRSLDERYFEQYYTKLIRYVAQGRLLRGSKRGSLLMERNEYLLGETVEVRAQLFDPAYEPLVLPKVDLLVTLPGRAARTVPLAADSQAEGLYHGQFTANEQGVYQLELVVPDGSEETLATTLSVRLPNLENDYSVRNDALLQAIAEDTGGRYFVGVANLRRTEGEAALNEIIKDVTRRTRVKGNPSRRFDRLWATLLLGVVSGALFIEWTTRRLSKLA